MGRARGQARRRRVSRHRERLALDAGSVPRAKVAARRRRQHLRISPRASACDAASASASAPAGSTRRTPDVLGAPWVLGVDSSAGRRRQRVAAARAPRARPPSAPHGAILGTPARSPGAPAFSAGARMRRRVGAARRRRADWSGRRRGGLGELAQARGRRGAALAAGSAAGAGAGASPRAAQRPLDGWRRAGRPAGTARAGRWVARAAGRTPARARPTSPLNANGRTRSPPPPAARAGTNDAVVAAASPSPWPEGRRPCRQTSSQGRRAALTCS